MCAFTVFIAFSMLTFGLYECKDGKSDLERTLSLKLYRHKSGQEAEITRKRLIFCTIPTILYQFDTIITFLCPPILIIIINNNHKNIILYTFLVFVRTKNETLLWYTSHSYKIL